jgi:hypothetical protein
MKFKVGDIVRYVKHGYENDQNYFIIGNVYKITNLRNEVDCFLNDITLYVFGYQIEKIENNKLNRVLYPEFFEVQDD